MEGENGATNLRVASFSCYLDTADNNFVHKIKKALDDPTPDHHHIISPQENSLQISSGRAKSSAAMVKASVNNHISQSPRVASFAHYLEAAEESFAFRVAAAAGATNLEKPKSKDGEIDIFGADRYFNMKLGDETKSNHECYTDRSADLARQKPNFGAQTPSVYSEASSWNSQTALLRNLQRNSAHQVKQKKALGRRLLTSFACTGPCLDRKAVYVTRSFDQGVAHGTNHSQQGSRTNDQDSSVVKTGLQDQKVEDPRQSLEVFGCKATRKGDMIPANLERKVSTLTWDAIPRTENPATTTLNSYGPACDDMASDASSDLFEIEHISGSGTYGLLTSQEPDNMSSCMSPTTLYAPSEASIEWSVVTASAADFLSVISDYEERSVSVAGDHLVPRHHDKTGNKNKVSLEVAAPTPKSRPGGLLGCKNQKAICVAETIHKTAEKPKHPGMDSYVSLGKLQASAKVKDIESIQSQQSFAARGLPPSFLN